MFGSGATILIISYEEMNDIKKIIKHLEESDFWIKTINNEANEQKRGYWRMLLVNLGASLLGNLLTSKGRIRGGKSIIRVGFNTASSFNKF